MKIKKTNDGAAMEWRGDKIKILAKEKNVSLAKLAELTGVSRQTVNGWIKGQIPKGLHLISICKIFEIPPEYLFSESENSITIPVHRTRMRAKVTPVLQTHALNLAKEYEVFFRNDTESAVLPVARVRSGNSKDAKPIARDLRIIAGVDQDKPLNCRSTFKLLEKLGIKTIFRYFPESLKTYAFFTKIHDHRVVFVNNETNVLDLIFPLIHEAVHAIRDEKPVKDVYDADEESFCDEVANHTQFPDEYVQWVWKNMEGFEPGVQIDILKKFAKKHGHALFGLDRLIKSMHPRLELKVGGANTNLKKEFPSIGEILLSDKDPRKFVDRLRELSPLFVNSMTRQIETMTDRKASELLGIENVLDAATVKEELRMSKNRTPMVALA